jgi:hypothetical protein
MNCCQSVIIGLLVLVVRADAAHVVAQKSGTAKQHLAAALAAAQLWNKDSVLIGVAGDKIAETGHVICDPVDTEAGWRFDFWGDGRYSTFRYEACGNQNRTLEISGTSPDRPRGVGVEFADSSRILEILARIARNKRYKECRYQVQLRFGVFALEGLKNPIRHWDTIASCKDGNTVRAHLDPDGNVLKREYRKIEKPASDPTAEDND